MEQILETEGLIKLYKRRRVINGINISVGNGEIVSIAGDKGAGKTTVLKVICGIERLDYGKVLLDKQEISSMNGKEAAKLRSKYIGVLSSDLPLQENMSVMDNVILSLILQGQHKRIREERAMELLCQVGLRHVAHARPKALKPYEEKCAQLAMGCCHRPKLVIADDFFCEMSREEVSKLQAHFKSLLPKSSAAIILSESNCLLADKFYNLKDGKLEDV